MSVFLKSGSHSLGSTTTQLLGSRPEQHVPRDSSGLKDSARPRNLAYIEYHGLGPVGAPNRLMDSFNNTYRAIRVIGGVENDLHSSGIAQTGRIGSGMTTTQTPSLLSAGNFLYAEWATDFLFQGPLQFHELYDLEADPWQMHNLYPAYSHAHKAQLWAMGNLTQRLYGCQGEGCL